MIYGNMDSVYTEGFDEEVDYVGYVEANMDVIPSYALTFSEAALYLAEDAENQFGELFKNIGISELAVFESTGMEVIYEGEKLNNFKEGFIKLWNTIWSNIKGFFENILEKFNKMKTEAKKKLYKKADLNNLKTKDKNGKEKVFGKTHKFDSSLMNAKYSDLAVGYAHRVSERFEKLAGQQNNENLSEEINNKQKQVEEEVCSVVSGISGVKDVKNMKEELKKKLMGEEIEATVAFVKSNYDEMRELVIGNKIEKSIKKDFAAAKKFINDRIKEVKKYKDDRAKVAKSEVKSLITICNCMNSCRGVLYDVMSRRYNEYRNIVVRVNMACGKANGESKDEKKEEKVSESYSSQLDLVESLFEW